MINTATVDGRHIAYTPDTLFTVQIGRGKGSYKTRYTFKGDLHQAWFYYNGINVGNGYKKRIVMVGANKPVLARQFS